MQIYLVPKQSKLQNVTVNFEKPKIMESVITIQECLDGDCIRNEHCLKYNSRPGLNLVKRDIVLFKRIIECLASTSGKSM